LNLGIDTWAIPLNAKTTVVVEAIGPIMTVHLNGVFAGFFEAPGTRPSGWAHLFVSDLWYTPANAVVANIRISAITKSQFPLCGLTNQMQLGPKYGGKVNVPVDYSLSFEITPKANVAGWSSIIHYSKDGKDNETPGSRMPAVFFHPGSTHLHIRIGLEGATNVGIDTASPLPLNTKTKVSIEAIGHHLTVYFNGVWAGFYVANAPRISGDAYLFLSDPFYQAADATIENVVLKAIQTSQVPRPDLASSFKLSQNYYGTVNVPADYELTFAISLLAATPNVWTSVLHYSKQPVDHGVEGSRMPGIWIHPDTTTLYVGFDCIGKQNEIVNTAALPLNVASTIKIRAVGKTVTLYVNNVSVSAATCEGDRISGLAHLFVSDPWYAPANANVKEICMVACVD